MQQAIGMAGTGCTIQLYLILQCPEDSEFRHWIGLRNASLGIPVESEDIITFNEDTTMVDRTSEVTVQRVVWGWDLRYLPAYQASGPINALTFLNQDCVGCGSLSVEQGLVVVGGDGDELTLTQITSDRFSSPPVALTTGISATNIPNYVYNDGNTIIIAAMDVDNVATATAGQLSISADRGRSFRVSTQITDGITKIVSLSGLLVAVGTDFTDGVIWTSSNRGGLWTEVVTTALAGHKLADAAADKDAVYAVSASGNVFKMLASGLVTNLTSNLPSAPTSLSSVAVLGPKHVVIAGAAGYFAESRDGGATWTTPMVPTASPILKVVGTLDRTVFITANTIFERNILTGQEFVEVELESGQTLNGTLTDVVMGRNTVSGFNYVAASTSTGQVIIGTPRYPNA
jgi:hypothetical protein